MKSHIIPRSLFCIRSIGCLKPIWIYLLGGFGYLLLPLVIGLSLSSPEFERLSQDHQEYLAVSRCWRRIRDRHISSTSACSQYAQFHMPFFAHLIQRSPVVTTCNLSQAHLAHAKRVSPRAIQFLTQLAQAAEEDCRFEGLFKSSLTGPQDPAPFFSWYPLTSLAPMLETHSLATRLR